MNIFKLSLILLIATTSSVCTAQVNEQQRQRRRAFVEDLLKGLLESQLDNNPKGMTPRPGDGQPPFGIPNVQPNKRMLDAREYFGAMSQTSNNLIGSLRQLESTSPSYRPMLADSLQIKAEIDALNQLANRYPDVQPLLPRFKKFDHDWRLLSYQLNQVGGLDNRCKRDIRRIDDYQAKLCGIFGVQPQIDRNRLVQLAASLNVSFEHLLQDIYYDMRAEPRMPTLIKQGRQLYVQINNSSTLINRGSYQQIVDAYRDCTTQWRKFNAQLGDFPSERIRRDIQSIDELGREISEQLWLPVEMDRSYIASLCKSINKDAEFVLENISMAQLLKSEAPGQLISAAREFQNNCNGFYASINSGKAREELRWEFQAFGTKWQALQVLMGQFDNPRIQRRLEEIENSMQVLTQTFGGGPVLTRHMLENILGELDDYVSDLSHEIHHLVEVPKYDRNFHNRICGLSDRLHDSIHKYRNQVLSRRKFDSNRELNQIFSDWSELKPLINQCQPQDRREINKFRSLIEPLMVKLQVVFVS